MQQSRLTRMEERKAKRLLFFGLVGITAISVGGILFGLKFLENFSLTAEKIRGKSPVVTQAPELLFPPELNPLTESTNSGVMAISGTANSALTVTLFINEQKTSSTVASQDGTFVFKKVTLSEGANAIQVQQSDSKNKSSLSDAVTVTVKKTMPDLEISAPDEGYTLSGDNNRLAITGKTNEANTVSINDRWVIVQSDGSFSYLYPLPEGETILKITASDQYGNTTVIERKVSYRK